MYRLFVALRPPRPMRTALLATMGGLERARWQSDEQLHLTLRFIGEVDRHQASDVAAALGGVHHPAFTLKLDGYGWFDQKGRIDALWASVAPRYSRGRNRPGIDRFGKCGISLRPRPVCC